jgi:hypothetical protein
MTCEANVLEKARELMSEVEVHRPRYLSVPGFFKRMDGVSMGLCSWWRARRLAREYRLNLLDVHFGYPDGRAGAFLARRQGLSALRAAQEQMQRGELPAGPMLDGILILLAGVLLITPGVLTDAFGFLLLFKSMRARIRAILADQFRRGVDERRIRVYGAEFHSPFRAEAYPGRVEETPPFKIH